MTYLLIDTNCLKVLVSKDQESYFLKLLQFWEQRGLIQLFYPEALEKEWQKHRVIEKEKIEKAINSNRKTLQLWNIDDANASSAKSKLLNQITTIDSLFDQAIRIDESPELKVKLFDLRREGKVPFRNKIASDNDASIIYSTLEYCQSENYESLIFISNNSGEFSSHDSKTKFHPDIADEFQDVEVVYFTELNEAFKFFKESLLFPDLTTNSLSTAEEAILNYYDANKPFLSELYKSICPFFKELTYIHPSLFLPYIPSLEGNNINVQTGFNLFTHNQYLYDLLAKIEMKNDEYIVTDITWIENVESYKDKIALIIKAFNYNCIWYIDCNSETKTVDLKELNEQENDFDFIEDFDFDNALEDLKNSEMPLFQQGWIYYRLGFFIEAAQCFEKAAIHFENSNKKLLSFICYFNLKHLLLLIRSYSWKEGKQTELVQRLKSLDLTEKQPASKFDKIISDWIINKQFFEKAFEGITHSFHDLRNLYHNSLNGGWSTSNNTNALISHYALFDSFINGNNIVFDFFREFEDLSDVFIESLIISHSIQGSNPKLQKFSNWHIYKILIHGNADKLIAYCKRYNLKKLLIADELKTNFFSKKLENLIKTKRVFENGNLHFDVYYRKLLINSIVLAYLTDIKNEEVKKITKQLISPPLVDTTFYSSSFKYILGFFKTWSGIIPSSFFKNLLFIIIKNGNLHNQGFFLDVSSSLLQKKKKLNLNEFEFKEILDFCFKQCLKCKNHHSVEAIVYIFKCLDNSAQKQVIQEKVHEALNYKFNSELYYSATIHDVITTKEEMFEQFAHQSVERNSIRLFNSKNRYHHVDALINLAFKLNKPLPEDIKKGIQSLDVYYEWLLNLESFDYSMFEPNWLTDYATKYYFDKFRRTPMIKKYLTNYLNKNRDDKITRIYFDLYKKRYRTSNSNF